MSKYQFTGTATQSQCNRKFCQFNKDQYCNKTTGQCQNAVSAYIQCKDTYDLVALSPGIITPLPASDELEECY